MSDWDVVDILEAMGHDPIALGEAAVRAEKRMDECCCVLADGVAGWWIDWKGKSWQIVCPECQNFVYRFGPVGAFKRRYSDSGVCPTCNDRGWRSLRDFADGAIPRHTYGDLVPYVAAHIVAGLDWPLPRRAFDVVELHDCIAEMRHELGIEGRK